MKFNQDKVIFDECGKSTIITVEIIFEYGIRLIFSQTVLCMAT